MKTVTTPRGCGSLLPACSRPVTAEWQEGKSDTYLDQVRDHSEMMSHKFGLFLKKAYIWGLLRTSFK